jgi:hypothetical protein
VAVRALVPFAVLAAFPALAVGAPLRVFVTAAQVAERKQVDDATKKDLKARREAAREARRALEKQLKEEHGKKRETWPREAEDRLAAAEEKEAVAAAAFEYLKVETKGLKDSVKDIEDEFRNGLVKEGVAALAASAAQADVVLQVEGRRGEKTLPTYFKPDRCFVLFSLGAGGTPNAARRLAKVPPGWRPKKVRAYKVQSPKPNAPRFVFEAQNGGGAELGCFSSAADAAMRTVGRLIEDNRAALSAN